MSESLLLQVLHKLQRGVPRQEVAKDCGVPLQEVDRIMEEARKSKITGMRPKMTHEQRRARLKVIADWVTANMETPGVRTRAAEKFDVSHAIVTAACKTHKVEDSKKVKPGAPAIKMFKLAAALLRGQTLQEAGDLAGLTRERARQLRGEMHRAGLFAAIAGVDKKVLQELVSRSE